jgi:hypothetical protein
MWLGQSQYWNDLEDAYLVSLAKTYLTEVEREKFATVHFFAPSGFLSRMLANGLAANG